MTVQTHFGLAQAHSMRPGRASVPVGNRIGALAATVAAHLLVIVALMAGLQQARIIRQPEVMVRFTPQDRKTEPERMAEAPSVIVAFDAAAPPPVVTIAPDAVTAPPPAVTFDFKLPPMMLPSPPNSASGGSNARATWETALLARLAAAKRVLSAPNGVSPQGVVQLRFVMDRDGAVLLARIERSSGVALLDQEALAALQRALPLPKPPAEVPGDTLDLIVPVDFYR